MAKADQQRNDEPAAFRGAFVAHRAGSAAAQLWLLCRPGPDHAGAEQEDGQTPGQLATRLGVRPPTITKTINRLQVQGFLDKRASDSDARQAHIFLTGTGREAIRAIERSVRKTEKQALKGLDKRDQKALAKLLSRVEANFSNGAVTVESDDEPELEE